MRDRWVNKIRIVWDCFFLDREGNSGSNFFRLILWISLYFFFRGQRSIVIFFFFFFHSVEILPSILDFRE